MDIPRPTASQDTDTDTPVGPGRELVDVGNTALAAEWLLLELGSGALSGMMLRGESVVFCPLIDEDGYRPPLRGGDHDGPAQVRPVDHHRLGARVSIAYTPFAWRKPKDGAPYRERRLYPGEAARTVLNLPDKAINLRSLRGVVHTPIPRADGTLITEPGYDEDTKLLYVPTVDVPDIPEHPTTAETAEAVALLRELVAEFVWVGEHDEANYLGLLLTPLLRELCPPPYKLGAIMARQPGSGKSLLARVLRDVHDGVFRSEIPADEAELRKSVTSILHTTTAPVVQFDNVTGTLRSATLAALLTSAVYTDRILGATVDVNAVNDRLWCLTGNNLNLGGDILRRAIWVTIDPKVKAPERRTGFKLNLPEHVAAHRGDILRALLILVAAWRDAGAPTTKRSSDDYAQWSATVRGILHVAGVPGEFDHTESAQQAVGGDDDEWGEFLEASYRYFGDRTWSTKDLLAEVEDGISLAGKPIPMEALPAELGEKAARAKTGVTSIAKSLGRWLMNRDGRFAGDYVSRAAGSTRDGKLWRIERSGDDR